MTKYELKEHHFQMWSSIMNEIVSTKNCVDIVEIKHAYCVNNGVKLKQFCALCEFAMRYDVVNCTDCPSILAKKIIDTHGCLGGIYQACVSTNDYLTQYTLASIIRDSWG